MKTASIKPKAYTRVLLKITGECFSTPERADYLVQEIAEAVSTGCELAIVVGGGNIIRGRQTEFIDRIGADQAGMVATIVNGIVLERRLNRRQIPARHLSALEIKGIVERFLEPAGRAALADKQVLVLTGGTGNPLFSTDTAAALRAREVGAQVLLKGTKVRGVFTADPKQNASAQFLPRVTYAAAQRRRLTVMDATAFALCAENRMPIVVFDFFKPGNLVRVIKGEEIGSIVC